ncbi:hypothetical protein G6F46_001009 [Rhizopus delemar]|uniref:K Homology domain-containing protein n=2 Tax=Rhizopus TaxID=4842 RepID=A0A9P6Z7S0_9FUNG|nr:hypothetical protein G6F43_011892 [Rhizopus delemar]KAG1551493.1 hypothetical protein G6F51_001807 [Rhizopus arrhizus]KAG1450785.1 hypothetical protein G6F55_009518 [Rhizopus delemar]KAG1488528.1 hypothetical protein G6F54_012032 [Rhizopus delemar]KAG1509056.1 hypothetical protein G6F52_011235 [Rhizopus delemar]
MDSQRFLEAHKHAQGYIPRVTLRAVLPNRHAGAIIGVKGCRVQSIESTYAVKVQMTPVLGRLVMISGSAKNVAKAWKVALMYLADTFSEYYKQNPGISFLISKDLVALLKNPLDINLNFEYMARSTHTQLRVKEGTVPRSSERVVQVSIQSMDQLNAFENLVYLLADVTRIYTHLSMSPETVYFIPTGAEDDVYIQNMKDETIFM